MHIPMGADVLKEELLPKYLASGEHKFYRSLLVYALNKLVLMERGEYKGISPNLEFLDYHDRFIVLYRREGEQVYLELARLFRKIAHRVYRIMLKKKLTPHNSKFLNMV